LQAPTTIANAMTRIAILGATGYSALELVKILLRHPGAEITAATSRQDGSPPLASVHPSLTGRIALNLEDLGPFEVATRAECVFSCLPHGVTANLVPQLLAAKCRVIDFSADYRLRDAEVYRQWYGEKHADPERLSSAVYGLPELFREQIVKAPLIANPGCYPTSAILALAPLLKAGLIEPDGIIIDSKSGVSGAGRTPKMTTLFPECNESISAYNVGRHRHTPEIEQVLSTAAGCDVQVIFTPHLVPMDRGILSTAYSRPRGTVSEQQALDALRGFYADEQFVRVVDHLPATKDTAGTNACHITARLVRDRVITISCLDNLIKGAAGAAVQNFNLMYGYDETTGL
jgi:N-acetyl-gamma-glutamyl-phosphate reductase